MLKKLKKNKKKGFTLVELIVVLVILAILAALLIPALTGYIDRAKRKTIVAETRQVVMAAQTLVDEEYSKDATADENTATTNVDVAGIQKLAEVDGTVGDLEVNGGKVTKIAYTSGGKTCTYYKTVPATVKASDGHYDVKTSTDGK